MSEDDQPMTPEVRAVYAGLQFRMPMLLRNVEPLTDEQMRWVPGPGRTSIAWQLWHIAEVEENWIGLLVLGEEPRFPFGVQVREAEADAMPGQQQLLDYLAEVRALTRRRLEAATPEGFDRVVEDPDFGRLTVREVWAGVVTSFAWHAGQIALTAKLLPESPVRPMKFRYWRRPE